MTNLLERSNGISEMLNVFTEDIEPIKNRFYNFLTLNQPQGSGIPDYDLSAYGMEPLPSEFALNVWEMGSGKGLTFETTVRDYGDSTVLYFTIPDAYLEDPDAFESALLQKNADEHLKARKIVAGVFGEEVLEDVSIEAYSMFTLNEDGSESDNEFLIIGIAPNEGKRPGRNDEHKFMLFRSRSYAWDVKTGKFYYGGWSTAYDIARKEEGISAPMGEVIL